MQWLNNGGKNMLEEFRKYLEIKGYCHNYYYRIKSFIQFCENNNIAYYEITYPQLQDWILSLKQENKNLGSINNHIKAMRQFYRYLIDYNHIPNAEILQTVQKVKLFEVERKIKDHITKEELDDMIEMGISFCGTISPEKLKALLYFFFYTGVRKGELLNLKRKDIDLENYKAIIRVPTKNRQERFVLFPKQITINDKKRDFKEILQAYFESEEETDNAFCMNIGTLSYLFNDLKNYVPGKKFNIHTMRHSFTRMLASKQIDVRVAQKLLGHKNIQSTLIYYDPDIDIIQDIYDDKIGKEYKQKKRKK